MWIYKKIMSYWNMFFLELYWMSPKTKKDVLNHNLPILWFESEFPMKNWGSHLRFTRCTPPHPRNWERASSSYTYECYLKNIEKYWTVFIFKYVIYYWKYFHSFTLIERLFPFILCCLMLILDPRSFNNLKCSTLLLYVCPLKPHTQ